MCKWLPFLQPPPSPTLSVAVGLGSKNGSIHFPTLSVYSAVVLLKWGLCVTHILLLEIFYVLWWNSSCDHALLCFCFISEASYYQFPKYERCHLSLLEQKLTVTTSLFEIHPCQCSKGEGDSHQHCSGC